MFSILFACETCRRSFPELNKFLEHKIQNHFEEFQNTKYIVFEERKIKSLGHEEAVVFEPTAQEIGEANSHGCTDSPKFKIENKNENDADRSSNSELSCDTIQNVGFIKTELQYSNQNGVDGVSHFIPSKNEDDTRNSEFDFKPSLNTVHTSQNPIASDNNYGADDKFSIFKSDLNFDENAIASPKLIASKVCSDFGPTQTFIESRQNPLVLLRRLTPREIQINSSVSEKASSSKRNLVTLDSALETTAKKCPSQNSSIFAQCKLCLCKFESDLELKTHVITCVFVHPHRRRFCVPCNRKFCDRRRLSGHISSRHGTKDSNHAKSDKSNQCKHCPLKFCNQSDLKRHAVTHTSMDEGQDARPFKCPMPHCSRTFKIKCSIRRHIIEVHSESLPFKCSHENCKKRFKGKSNLRKHLLMHKKRVPLKCPHEGCLKTFLSKGSIRLHIKNHSDRRPFNCTQADCEKSFSSIRLLTNHLVSHSDERTFKCLHPNCAKRFKTKFTLGNHVENVHSKSRPFKCPEIDCAKSYKNSNALQQHKITHTESRPFKCPEIDCEKSFNNKFSLVTHGLVHSDARPFPCTYLNCGRAFKSQSILNWHLKNDSPSFHSAQINPRIRKAHGIGTGTGTGTGISSQSTEFAVHFGPIWRFECKELKCKKSFLKKSTLKRHHCVAHSDERPFKCPVANCKYKCKVKGDLKVHLRTKLHANLLLSELQSHI